ncbi:MAG: hypothetical protein LBR67_05730 [Dysgonamonadaceae bacterium]|jgi:hypothetical protein|nr:hypothetical protein [Dysgonamonadaceae bacterium]
MKRFFLRLVVFLIPVGLFVVFLELCVRQMPSDYQQKRDQLLENADSIQVLILGSSGEMDGVDPNQISLYAHNLAFGSQTIYYDRRLTEKYAPSLKNLKYVLIDFNYSSLASEHAPERDFFYHYYYGIDYEGRKFCKESLLQSLFVYPSKYLLLQIYRQLRSPATTTGQKGWQGGWPDVMSESEMELKEKANDYYRIEVHLIEEHKESVLKDLESLLLFLKSRNIVPVLLTPPNYSGFRQYLTDEKPFLSHDSISDQLTQKYRITHLNYFSDDSFEKTDFHNYNHLNREGAAKLTRKIDDFIRTCEDPFSETK